jgi:hypothetical protein
MGSYIKADELTDYLANLEDEIYVQPTMLVEPRRYVGDTIGPMIRRMKLGWSIEQY